MLLKSYIRLGDARIRKTHHLFDGFRMVLFVLANLAKFQRMPETGINTGWLQVLCESIDTHITFADRAGVRIEGRGFVWAHPGTIPASKANIAVDDDGTGVLVFHIGPGWTSC